MLVFAEVDVLHESREQRHRVLGEELGDQLVGLVLVDAEVAQQIVEYLLGVFVQEVLREEGQELRDLLLQVLVLACKHGVAVDALVLGREEGLDLVREARFAGRKLRGAADGQGVEGVQVDRARELGVEKQRGCVGDALLRLASHLLALQRGELLS